MVERCSPPQRRVSLADGSGEVPDPRESRPCRSRGELNQKKGRAKAMFAASGAVSLAGTRRGARRGAASGAGGVFCNCVSASASELLPGFAALNGGRRCRRGRPERPRSVSKWLSSNFPSQGAAEPRAEAAALRPHRPRGARGPSAKALLRVKVSPSEKAASSAPKNHKLVKKLTFLCPPLPFRRNPADRLSPKPLASTRRVGGVDGLMVPVSCPCSAARNNISRSGSFCGGSTSPVGHPELSKMQRGLGRTQKLSPSAARGDPGAHTGGRGARNR